MNVRPAIVYRMDGDRAQQLNVNKSKIEILAGVTYRSQAATESTI